MGKRASETYDVRVPASLIDPVKPEVFADRIMVGIAVYNVELGESLYISRGWVPLDRTKMPTVLVKMGKLEELGGVRRTLRSQFDAQGRCL